MKRYSSLIRKLVDAVAYTEGHDNDVIDILKQRCSNDSDIVRITLMNAVCDPRVKIHASYSGPWKRNLREALERFSDHLSGLESLSRETADSELEDFLRDWHHSYFTGIRRTEIIPVFYSEDPAEKEVKTLEDAQLMLDDLKKDFCSGLRDGSPTRSDTGKGPTRYRADTDDNGDTERPEGSDNTEEVADKRVKEGDEASGPGTIPLSRQSLSRLEDRFLKKIPASLMALVRKVGRMGEEGVYKAGRFLTAARSDISGITVGNNLSSVLPSELAMLADPVTEPVFLSNYTSGRLQIFASASQVKSDKEHQHGPIILCIDHSGSMSGQPLMVARILCIAICIIAWRKHRDVTIVKYADCHTYLPLGRNNSRLGDLISFLPTEGIGGNEENGMFQWLFKEVGPLLPAYDTADILCVSDFGWSDLTGKTTEMIEVEKQKGMRFYGLNIGNCMLENTEDGTPMDVCDSVWSYYGNECVEIKKMNSVKRDRR